MPRSIAVASSAWHIIGTTTEKFGLTANPTGLHASDAIRS